MSRLEENSSGVQVVPELLAAVAITLDGVRGLSDIIGSLPLPSENTSVPKSNFSPTSYSSSLSFAKSSFAASVPPLSLLHPMRIDVVPNSRVTVKRSEIALFIFVSYMCFSFFDARCSSKATSVVSSTYSTNSVSV